MARADAAVRSGNQTCAGLYIVEKAFGRLKIITLAYVAFVLFFSVPKLHQLKKPEIDQVKPPSTMVPTVDGTSSQLPHSRATAKGSPTTVSRSDIRLIQHLDSSALGLVRRWRLIGDFPIHLLPSTRLESRVLCAKTSAGVI